MFTVLNTHGFKNSVSVASISRFDAPVISNPVAEDISFMHFFKLNLQIYCMYTHNIDELPLYNLHNLRENTA
jgi:hypothetical protein